MAEACNYAATGLFSLNLQAPVWQVQTSSKDTPRWKDNVKYPHEGTESKNVNKIELAKYKV
jgi:hypothetical protein